MENVVKSGIENDERPGNPVMKAEPMHRFMALDALRGTSVLIVVIFHYMMAYTIFTLPGLWSVMPVNLLWDGFAAVSVFFVLSGFVLSYGYLEPANRQPVHLRSFYLARAIRILGPYSVAFLLSLFCVHVLFLHETPGSEWQLQLFLDTWLKALSMSPTQLLREFFLLEPAPRYHVMIQAWTLSVELYLSLLFPLFIVLMRRSELLFIAVLFLLSIYYWLPLPHPQPMMVSGIVHFMLGMVLARYRTVLANLTLLRITWLRWLLFAIGIVCLSVRYTINMPLRLFHPFGFEVWNIAAFGAFIVICAALVSRPFQRVLCTPLIIWLGRISYSVYLLHIIVLYLLVPRAMHAVAALGCSDSTVWLAGMAATVAFSLLLAQGFYWSVERPFTRLARRVSSARQRTPLPA